MNRVTDNEQEPKCKFFVKEYIRKLDNDIYITCHKINDPWQEYDHLLNYLKDKTTNPTEMDLKRVRYINQLFNSW